MTFLHLDNWLAGAHRNRHAEKTAPALYVSCIFGHIFVCICIHIGLAPGGQLLLVSRIEGATVDAFFECNGIPRFQFIRDPDRGVAPWHCSGTIFKDMVATHSNVCDMRQQPAWLEQLANPPSRHTSFLSSTLVAFPVSVSLSCGSNKRRVLGAKCCSRGRCKRVHLELDGVSSGPLLLPFFVLARPALSMAESPTGHKDLQSISTHGSPNSPLAVNGLSKSLQAPKQHPFLHCYLYCSSIHTLLA